jgi:sigma-B regulation protein RsbU (phosphoserine phosphatase)
MRKRAPVFVYCLLGLYIAISLAYQIAGSVGLVVGFFDLRHQVQEPFQTEWYRPVVTSMSPEAAKAGLAKGDTVETIDGVHLRGRALVQAARWYAHPGGHTVLGVVRPDGNRATISIPLRGYNDHPGFGESVFVLFLHIAVPLFSLLIGYWVALARPTDPNAWLILVLLSLPESFISVSTYNAWPGPWLVLRLAWHLVLNIMAPAALLWFGLVFPERSRIDARIPWLKWLALGIQGAGLAWELLSDYGAWYDPSFVPHLQAIDTFVSSALNWTDLLWIALYWVAIFSNLRTATNADTIRRLRVLCAGSIVGLGSTLIVWGLLPRFGIDPATKEWLGYVSATLLLIFPLSLGYVVVVQRALDVRILMRMGTRYLLARATFEVIQIVAIGFLLIAYVVPMLRRHERGVYIFIPIFLLALFIRINFVKRSPAVRIREWLDRRFFREAYQAELVLSELTDRIRAIPEPFVLIETVRRRVSEVLHVPRTAVLLRSADVFTGGAIALAATSAPVQHLVKTNSPAVLYRDRPDDWFIHSSDRDQQALDAARAEVLLPLRGRDKLMGVMLLGPKLSEEPYSPTDLRLLASIGIQTGIGLEIGEMAQSLAREMSRSERIQREIEIARDVQERLFPQRVPQIPGLELAGHCRPALAVGGDYYDMIELEDGRLALAIGDVSGKGIGAALLMASLRASLHGLLDADSTDLARLVSKLNRLVFESSASHRYATFFLAVYDPRTRALGYVNGGHNPPVVLRGSGEVVRLEACGPVIGLLPSVQFEERTEVLQPGDIFIGYTDGISEAMTSDDEEWGEDRMIEAALANRSLCPKQLLDAMMACADRFTAGAPQHDDMTLIIGRFA